MQKQRSQREDRTGGFCEAQSDSSVLAMMLCDSSYVWTVDEIAREIRSRVEAEDSVRRLTETGLVHRFGEFVFPTRTARRANDLQIGTA
jgi:hypothetical protein